MNQVNVVLCDGIHITVPYKYLKESKTFMNCFEDVDIDEINDGWRCDYHYPKDMKDFFEAYYPVVFDSNLPGVSFYSVDLFRFFSCAEYLDMPKTLTKLGQYINNIITTVCPINVPVYIYKIKKNSYPQPLAVQNIEVHHQLLLPNNASIIYKHLIENIIELFPTILFTEYLLADAEKTKVQLKDIAYCQRERINNKINEIRSTEDNGMMHPLPQTGNFQPFCIDPQLVKQFELGNTLHDINLFIETLEKGVRTVPYDEFMSFEESLAKHNDFTSILAHSAATPYLAKKLMKEIDMESVLSRRYTSTSIHNTTNTLLDITEKYDTVGDYLAIIQKKLLEHKSCNEMMTQMIGERIDLVNNCNYIVAINNQIDVGVLKELSLKYGPHFQLCDCN